MNLLAMLVRLEDALGRRNLAKQMVLYTPSPNRLPSYDPETINLLVGYNGSPGSQTALDLTLWIAHQTRLATSQCVNVQVVYVIEPPSLLGESLSPAYPIPVWRSDDRAPRLSSPSGTSETSVESRRTAVIEMPQTQAEQFDYADRILWQARCLADEWRGALKTHLRFGSVASELRKVAQAEQANLLLLGCDQVDNWVVQQLDDLACPLLGIPPLLEEN